MNESIAKNYRDAVQFVVDNAPNGLDCDDLKKAKEWLDDAKGEKGVWFYGDFEFKAPNPDNVYHVPSVTLKIKEDRKTFQDESGNEFESEYVCATVGWGGWGSVTPAFAMAMAEVLTAVSELARFIDAQYNKPIETLTRTKEERERVEAEKQAERALYRFRYQIELGLREHISHMRVGSTRQALTNFEVPVGEYKGIKTKGKEFSVMVASNQSFVTRTG